MADQTEVDPQGALAGLKQQAAALALGAPFYAVVVVLMLAPPRETLALALYGVGAGGWLAWRARRILRG
jgi:hypothetical protein